MHAGTIEPMRFKDILTKKTFYCRTQAFQNTSKAHNDINFGKEVKTIMIVDTSLHSLVFRLNSSKIAHLHESKIITNCNVNINPWYPFQMRQLWGHVFVQVQLPAPPTHLQRKRLQLQLLRKNIQHPSAAFGAHAPGTRANRQNACCKILINS